MKLPLIVPAKKITSQSINPDLKMVNAQDLDNFTILLSYTTDAIDDPAIYRQELHRIRHGFAVAQMQSNIP